LRLRFNILFTVFKSFGSGGFSKLQRGHLIILHPEDMGQLLHPMFPSFSANSYPQNPQRITPRYRLSVDVWPTYSIPVTKSTWLSR
jgi:hypothetical protein